jgi:hypothetical protein
LRTSTKIQSLADKVSEKTSKYDGKAAVDPYKGGDQIGFFEMVMRYATFKDKFFFAITVFAIFTYGASRPVFSTMFGQVSGNVNKAAHNDNHKAWE